MPAWRLTLVLCLADALNMAGYSAVAALLPALTLAWSAAGTLFVLGGLAVWQWQVASVERQRAVDALAAAGYRLHPRRAQAMSSQRMQQRATGQGLADAGVGAGDVQAEHARTVASAC